jgi:hypothetical protein
VKSGSILALIFVLGASYYARTHFREWILSAASGSTPTCLEMLGSTTSEVDGATRIVGSVKNNCDRKYLYVQIEFTLDQSTAENPVVRDLPEMKMSAAVRDLQPGETMQFQTAIVSKTQLYRFDGITAY